MRSEVQKYNICIYVSVLKYARVTELQWNVGDCCQATFRGDGRLYQAIIKKIRKKKSGLVVAQVEFIGYGVRRLSILL